MTISRCTHKSSFFCYNKLEREKQRRHTDAGIKQIKLSTLTNAGTIA